MFLFLHENGISENHVSETGEVFALKNLSWKGSDVHVHKSPGVRFKKLPKMPTARDDSDDVFLLPFECKPEYSLAGELSNQDEDSTFKFFKTLNVLVPSDIPGDSEPIATHAINAGSFVLLRPPTNGSLPFVGKALKFFEERCGKTVAKRMRINWYYRPTDLLDKPKRTHGEDEVLETPHFNDVDVETVVGLCTVTDYQQYVHLMNKEQHVSAKPVFDAHEKDDDNGSSGTLFWDHYASCSTRMFCRDYYDACADVLTTSAFDDPNVDPYEEPHSPEARENSSDESIKIDDSESMSSSDDDDDDDTVSTHSKRKRRRQSATRIKGRESVASARYQAGSFQFCLPVDICSAEELPCRDAEKATIRRFLETAIRDSVGDYASGDRCIYISGVPGTGKTATVREIIRVLKKQQSRGEFPAFEVVETNGMNLPQPSLIYSEIYAAVVGKRGVPPDRAKRLLEVRFNQSSGHEKQREAISGVAAKARLEGKCVVLILDELDILVSRSQEILYDVLEWSTRKNSKLAVIGIANTMDLPERLLPRLKSRMGNNRLVYPPYTKDQLMTILNLSLSGWSIKFEGSAKKLVAAKVAAVSGDVRRAMEICRRARQIAEKQQQTGTKEQRDNSSTEMSVSANHVNAAVGEMTGDQRLKCFENLSAFERLIVVTALKLCRSIGAFDVEASSSLSAIFAKARQIAVQLPSIFHDSILQTDDLMGAVSRLVTQRIVILERSTKPSNSRLVLNVSPEDCMFALSEDKIANLVLHGTQISHKRQKT